MLNNEIKNVIFSMKPMKAPGSDGLQALFFQNYWDIVGDSVHNLIKEMIEKRECPRDLNMTCVTLIPEIENPTQVSQFRPISLCNVPHKILTKLTRF